MEKTKIADLFKKKTVILGIILVVLIVIGTTAAGYFYFQFRKSQKLLADPAALAKKEVAALVQRVGKLMELPSDEEPTIATISDKTKLSAQPFFARAKNGDKVLIYTQAKKAILYDPIANKIIDVTNINVAPSPSATSSPSLTPTKSAQKSAP